MSYPYRLEATFDEQYDLYLRAAKGSSSSPTSNYSEFPYCVAVKQGTKQIYKCFKTVVDASNNAGPSKDCESLPEGSLIYIP